MTLTITEPLVRKLLATVDAGLVNGVGKPIPGQMCVEAAICYALGEPHSDGPSCVEPTIRAAKIRLNDAQWSSPQARARGMRRAAIAQLGSLGVVDGQAFRLRHAELTIREIVPIALRAAARRVPSHAVTLEASAVRCAEDGAREAALAARYAADSAAYAADSAAYAAWAAAYAAADSAAYAYAAAYAAASAAADSAAYAAADADSAAYAYAAAYAAASAAAYAAADADSAVADRDRVLGLAAEIQVRVMQELGSPGCAWLWLCDEAPA